jgi:hypothetical protein
MAEQDRTRQLARGAGVRGSDLEPYTALRWLGTLFKAAAIFLFVALVSEFIAGLRFEGAAALPTLLGELARTLVLAVVLWGGGDLVRLLINVGHDIRAQRILAGRIAARTGDDLPGGGSGLGDGNGGGAGDVARRRPPGEAASAAPAGGAAGAAAGSVSGVPAGAGEGGAADRHARATPLRRRADDAPPDPAAPPQQSVAPEVG